MKICVLPVAALALMSSGCLSSNVKPTTGTLTPEAVTYVAMPGEYRAAYAIKKGSGTVLCAEPPPDVAMETLASLVVGLDVANQGSADINGEAEAKPMELSGRSEVILLAREFLYRSCEMGANMASGAVSDDADRKFYRDAYKQILSFIRELSQAEKLAAEAELLEIKMKYKQVVKQTGGVVEDIVNAFKGEDGTLDAAKLANWTSTKAAVSQRIDTLKNSKDLADFERRLRQLPPARINELYDALDI